MVCNLSSYEQVELEGIGHFCERVENKIMLSNILMSCGNSHYPSREDIEPISSSVISLEYPRVHSIKEIRKYCITSLFCLIDTFPQI